MLFLGLEQTIIFYIEAFCFGNPYIIGGNKKIMAKKKVVRSRKKSPAQKKIALERISELFRQAEKIHVESQKLADRYVSLARKISLRYKVSFSREQKASFCKKCSSFLVPGKNSRARTSNGKLVVQCLNCKAYRRFVYK